MGQVVELAVHRARIPLRTMRGGVQHIRAAFHFELSCPFTYLAAERVDRSFAAVDWIPVSRATATRPGGASLCRLRRAAEARADQLRMPLVWPESFPAAVPATMRVAGYAASVGRSAEFALAAGRLAFCGGFDLEDPEIIAEAAAAAGLGLEASLAAARDRERDRELEAAGWRLRAVGADRLPALSVGRSLFWGEERVVEAAAAARTRAPVRATAASGPRA
jgi:2-hydroxychromene-2-carboxylate isomerase